MMSGHGSQGYPGVLGSGVRGEWMGGDTMTETTDQTTIAMDAGRKRGHHAGTWIIDGNTAEAEARWILQGIEDGDPEVMDMQPSPLSGEWAGESIPELSAEYGVDLEDDEIADAFEAGFGKGFWEEVERSARAMTDDSELFSERGEIAGELPAEENGWARKSVWAGTQNTSPDDAIFEWTAYYEHRSGMCLDVLYTVRETMTTNQPEVVRAFIVDECGHSYWRNAAGEIDETREEEYNYESSDVFFYPTADKAGRKAREYAMSDESWKLGEIDE